MSSHGLVLSAHENCFCQLFTGLTCLSGLVHTGPRRDVLTVIKFYILVLSSDLTVSRFAEAPCSHYECINSPGIPSQPKAAP